MDTWKPRSKEIRYEELVKHEFHCGPYKLLDVGGQAYLEHQATYAHLEFQTLADLPAHLLM